jgi:hypothetical protein
MTSEKTNDAAKAEEILNRIDANGQPKYDQVSRDPATGEWRVRRSDDHRVVERPS